MATIPVLPGINTGTSGKDTFIDNNRTANSQLFGVLGTDGKVGDDTVDFSNLGVAITVKPPVVPTHNLDIIKGTGAGAGVDEIDDILTIIGAPNKANALDGSTATDGTFINVNLAQKSFKILNIPFIDDLSFTIENFRDVTGTKNNDVIVGSNLGGKLNGGAGDDLITGGAGNDTISGGEGNDIITGTNRTARGVGEVDTLFGDNGRDIFVLGDSQGAYYVGSKNTDRAVIKDFNQATDTLDIGALRDFSFKVLKSGVIELFAGKDASTRDLIADIQLAPSISPISRSFGSPLDVLTTNSTSDQIAAQFSILSGSSSVANTIV
jgi:RTX calcium-binding nonapeptide repeat (4 copies)